MWRMFRQPGLAGISRFSFTDVARALPGSVPSAAAPAWSTERRWERCGDPTSLWTRDTQDNSGRAAIWRELRRSPNRV